MALETAFECVALDWISGRTVAQMLLLKFDFPDSELLLAAAVHA
jgi:hypothetical protein